VVPRCDRGHALRDADPRPNTQATYDQAIRERILDTEGVLSVDAYSSELINRRLSVSATVTTIYGQATVTEVL
jgi:hypothetical protein